MVKLEAGKTKKRSIIHKYFTKEIYLEILKVTMIADANNNDKGDLIREILNKNNIPFNGLGNGTNRFAVQIDGYAVKFGLDRAGMIDNRREAKYSKLLQPHVIKVYECTPNGLIAVTEFVEIFTMDDFHQRRGEMAEILSEISQSFLLGDVGITSKNYVNWGKRMDDSLCILDFAYIYSVTYNTFKCDCPEEALLQYDDNFVNLICPVCGNKYDFRDIRRRITKKDEENEIGDIREIGYNIHKDEEIVDIIEKFEPEDPNVKYKKEKDPLKELNKQHRKQMMKEDNEEEDDNDDYYWDN